MTVPAPGVAGRYGMRVRTPELPMAFTWGEFARGAGLAWFGFQLLFPLVYVVISLVGSVVAPGPGSTISSTIGTTLLFSLYTFVYALPWSIGALLLAGGPLAWLLGLALRRVRAIWPHLLAFAVLGAAVGGTTAWIATTVMSGTSAGLGLTVPAAVVTAGSVVFGWWRASRRALADDDRLARYAEAVAVAAAAPTAEPPAP